MCKTEEEILEMLRKKVGVEAGGGGSVAGALIDKLLVGLSKVLFSIVRVTGSIAAAIAAFVITWQASGEPSVTAA